MNLYLQKVATPGLLILLTISVCFTGCKDDEEPKTPPVVTTAVVTSVTTTTATAGGQITSDGNATITSSGVVYSSTNNPPTVTDSKTESGIKEGVFSSELAGLTSGTLYYVRGYAINEVGTGYGETVTFTTGNAAPTATNITITGTVRVLETLTAAYTYTDNEDDAEAGTTVQWYVANDAAGTGEAPIENATELTYKLQTADEFKYIRVGITTKAASGTSPGVEVKSDFVGPVAEEPIIVTFTYNGQQVSYGVLISSVTGRRWLDRNLGAPNNPTAYDDYANYGDAFQWGRAADGHQLVNRAATNSATTGVNGDRDELANTPSPNDNKFILTTVEPQDWLTPQNNNLWQGTNGINNPCPEGWRIPTIEEWQDENLTDFSVAYSQLNITLGGYRSRSNGRFLLTTSNGYYWSSSITAATEGAEPMFVSKLLIKSSGSAPFVVYTATERAIGASCRCIKD